jgi:hypothetical protein
LVIGGPLSKYWNNYWILIWLWLNKSGVECAVLAGSSLFCFFKAQRPNSPILILSVLADTLARAARDFFKEFQHFGT